MKRAVLSLDVEDWYHLDYFDRAECDTTSSLLDGLDAYIELIESLSIPSSFFVLGEIAEQRVEFFKNLDCVFFNSVNLLVLMEDLDG